MTGRRAAGRVARARPRDAEGSRRALLDAARALFGERGFEATTTREIGERAGVDPSLIARYFGNKADLYIAAVVTETSPDAATPALDDVGDVVAAMLARTDAQGLGPATQALIRCDAPVALQRAAQGHIARRLVAPVVADLERRGLPDAQLRAETIVAALIGITLGRSLGWFEELSAVARDRLVDLTTTLVDGR